MLYSKTLRFFSQNQKMEKETTIGGFVKDGKFDMEAF
jgi:hypothetical protein